MITNHKHEAFLTSPRKHALMLTIHGIHQWDIVPGLPDTGGQNVFVNQFSQVLADHGLKITIANRGGYPHPLSGENRVGLRYKDQHQRILYLEDRVDQFLRKEDMAARVPELVASLNQNIEAKLTPVDLIISHYWDAGWVGELYHRSLEVPVSHIWVPHSLGAIKKANVSPGQWGHLKIDQRIWIENEILRAVDWIGSTSTRIQAALIDDYGYSGPVLWLPPCVDPDRFYPRPVLEDDGIWIFLSQHSQLSPAEVRNCKIITEISRTDTTKRKDILIQAFAHVHERNPATLLVTSIDEHQQSLANELRGMIHELQIDSHIAVVGSIWDLLPTLYAVTDVYCTPSIMEGFGMSAQEATASGVPVVASEKVPFASEYLLGNQVRQVDSPGDSKKALLFGEGAVVVPADDVSGFAFALEYLLKDEALRKRMGAQAYRITIPKFTWKTVVATFLEQLNL